MGFWIFMLLFDLLIPATLIGFGRMFLHHPPGQINGLFGYRTRKSMQNQDTWTFAHQYCGRLWRAGGWILLPLTVLCMLLVLGQNKDTIGIVGGILCDVQLIVLVGAIFPTERALKKTFDKDGNRRQV